MDQRKVRGLVPQCGQDSYRFQVQQPPVYLYLISMLFIFEELVYCHSFKYFNITKMTCVMKIYPYY